MKSKTLHQVHPRAFSLIETVLAIGVLAVAIPLVFVTIAQAGKSELSSEAETRCAWMVPVCMEEIQASREGRPQYFSATSKGGVIPPSGDVWALGFGPDGKVIGRISKAVLENGAGESDGKSMLYLASMSASSVKPVKGETPLMNVKIAISYPASVSMKRRNKIDFHTLIP